jgi:hypothetical protein
LFGSFASPPAAATIAPNRIDVFAIDTAGLLRYKWNGYVVSGPQAWQPSGNQWEFVPVTLATAPVVVSRRPWSLDLFGVAGDNGMVRVRFSATVGGPLRITLAEYLGGEFTSPPVVQSLAPSHVAVFGLASNGEVVMREWFEGPPGTLGNWTSPGWVRVADSTSLVSAPAILRDGKSIEVVGILGEGNDIIHYSQRHLSGAGWQLASFGVPINTFLDR